MSRLDLMAPYSVQLRTSERNLLSFALEQAEGDVELAASLLGIEADFFSERASYLGGITQGTFPNEPPTDLLEEAKPIHIEVSNQTEESDEVEERTPSPDPSRYMTSRDVMAFLGIKFRQQLEPIEKRFKLNVKIRGRGRLYERAQIEAIEPIWRENRKIGRPTADKAKEIEQDVDAVRERIEGQLSEDNDEMSSEEAVS